MKIVSEKSLKKVAFHSEVIGKDGEGIFRLYEWYLDDKTYAIKRNTDILDNENIATFDEDERAFLNKIYKKNLKEISNYLNKIHSLESSSKDWEILIGPWLRISVFSFYDRWRTIENLHLDKEIMLLTEKFKLENLVSNDFDHFHKIFYQDRWNGHIYAILATVFNINLEIRNVDIENTTKDKYESNKKDSNGIIRKLTSSSFKLLFYISYFYNFLFGNNKISVLYNLSSYRKFSFFLFFRGKGFPLVMDKFDLRDTKSISKSMRLRPLAQLRKHNKKELTYEDFVFPLLIMTLPKTYLENFESIGIYRGSKSLEKKIGVVFSSTSHWTDDSFKKWLFRAKQDNKDLKIIIWQHGGTYGTTKYLTHQEYIETKVYDYFLSWGWSSEKENIIPFVKPFNLIKLLDSNKKSQGKKVLVILTRLKKYSKGDSWDSQEWNSTYVSSMINLSNKLRQNIDIDLTYRIHPTQKFTGLDIKDYLEEKNSKSIF